MTPTPIPEQIIIINAKLLDYSSNTDSLITIV